MNASRDITSVAELFGPSVPVGDTCDLSQARRFAVQFEQDAAEMERRISLACAAIDETCAARADCDCELTADGVLVECFPHRIESILRATA